MTILNKIRNNAFLSKFHHPRIHISFKKGIPEEKLTEVQKMYKLTKRDSVYIIVENPRHKLSGLKLLFVLSNKGISYLPEDHGSFMLWEEIENTEYFEDETGRIFAVHFQKNIATYFNVDLFKIKKEFWINLSELINEFINFIPPDKGRIISRLVDLCEKNPKGKEYLDLKNIYVKKFKRSISYKFFLKKLEKFEIQNSVKK